MPFPTATEPAARPIAVTALETYHAVQHFDRIQCDNGRVNVGEIELKDRGQWWKIKVCWRAELGHFLKLEQILGENQNFRALVYSLHSEGDRPITPDEWELFAMLVDDRRNYALRMGAQKCLGRLTQKAPELAAATRG